MRTAYFDSSKPRILAHRGLAVPGSDENSEEAFANAIAGGIEYLEIDVQTSKDGVAFVLHDADLNRIAGIARGVSELSAEELHQVRLLNGSKILTLEQTLNLFPTAKFNIDVKAAGAIENVRTVIASHLDRVLITSFSDARRIAASKGLKVATSAGARTTLLAWCTYLVPPLLGLVLRGVDALQIPRSQGPLRLDTRRFIEAVKAKGVEVHYWVINDPDEAKLLVARGADGIVSDRADLIKIALAE